jgi:guanyl-specific ribonuclease Sa
VSEGPSRLDSGVLATANGSVPGASQQSRDEQLSQLRDAYSKLPQLPQDSARFLRLVVQYSTPFRYASP